MCLFNCPVVYVVVMIGRYSHRLLNSNIWQPLVDQWSDFLSADRVWGIFVQSHSSLSRVKVHSFTVDVPSCLHLLPLCRLCLCLYVAVYSSHKPSGHSSSCVIDFSLNTAVERPAEHCEVVMMGCYSVTWSNVMNWCSWNLNQQQCTCI